MARTKSDQIARDVGLARIKAIRNGADSISVGRVCRTECAGKVEARRFWSKISRPIASQFEKSQNPRAAILINALDAA
jgi:hypothetical protein